MTLLSDTPVDRYDLVILSIGVNDVTALRSPRQWLQLQDQLTKLIETRFRPQLVIHCAATDARFHWIAATAALVFWTLGARIQPAVGWRAAGTDPANPAPAISGSCFWRIGKRWLSSWPSWVHSLGRKLEQRNSGSPIDRTIDGVSHVHR